MITHQVAITSLQLVVGTAGMVREPKCKILFVERVSIRMNRCMHDCSPVLVACLHGHTAGQAN